MCAAPLPARAGNPEFRARSGLKIPDSRGGSAAAALRGVVWGRGRNKTIRLERADTIFGNSAEIRPEISSAVLDGSSEKLNKILEGRAAGSRSGVPLVGGSSAVFRKNRVTPREIFTRGCCSS